ncbi:uncharacterized protein FIBRA_07298 [Fibroporia radiculosa]|uniref:Cytochrome P450 n=1 Tax=Fibroporia radiculosa TaxID=599839 RepID=J4IBQ9_9APHY|nr:uncharacterized protein FIBRA_07298 [Fibroporia radiculosa]CCM05091.1 predicted protein [Fibroporia radiculosa]
MDRVLETVVKITPMANWTSDWTRIAVAAAVIYVLSRIAKYYSGLQAVGYLPGKRCAYPPLSFLDMISPWGKGLRYLWNTRFHDFYAEYGTDTISVVPWFASTPQIHSADMEVLRQLMSGGVKSPWFKFRSPVMEEWGHSLFTVEREEWQKHRKILAPAFSSEMYAYVWDQAVRAYHDMIAHEGWADQDTVEITVLQRLTSKLAFLLLAVCGFGLDASWSDPTTTSTGGMTVPHALRIFVMPSIAVLLPKWMRWIPLKQVRDFCHARGLLDQYMRTQVNERRKLVKSQIELNEEGSRDIFSVLVRANELNARSVDTQKLTLSDGEVISNVFLMLFAGHETSAETLAATFALLAVHQDVQEVVYQQIIDVVGTGRDPTPGEYHQLDKVLNAFYEASRMFPASFSAARVAAEDSTLVVPNAHGSGREGRIIVRKGVLVVGDTLGIEYNPRYYPEPEKFLPSRWEGDDKTDLVSSFGVGQRTCIGRRFATTEAVAFLTMWLRDWKVEPLLKPGESVDEWTERIVDARFFLTLGIQDVPVRMKRRAQV